jgi:hypothetical protein
VVAGTAVSLAAAAEIQYSGVMSFVLTMFFIWCPSTSWKQAIYFHPSVEVGGCGELAVGEEVWLYSAENALAVSDVDRPVEVADSELKDVTKLDVLEVFGSVFKVEEGVEEDGIVKEVDRLIDEVDNEVEDVPRLDELETFDHEVNVEEVDNKVEGVTKLDELELFGSGFDVEEAEEEGVEVVVPDCVGTADEVFGTVLRVVKLEDDVWTEAYSEIEDEDLDFDEDLWDDKLELDGESPEGEEVRVNVDGEE